MSAGEDPASLAEMWDWPVEPVPAADRGLLAAVVLGGLAAQGLGWGAGAALGVGGLSAALLAYPLGVGLGAWAAGRARPWSPARVRYLASRLGMAQAVVGALVGAVVDGPRAALGLAALGAVAGLALGACAVGAAWHAIDPRGAASVARPARWRRR